MSPEFDAFGRPVRPGSGDGASSEPAPSGSDRPRRSSGSGEGRSSSGERPRRSSGGPGATSGGGGGSPGWEPSSGGGRHGGPQRGPSPGAAARRGCGCAGALIGVAVAVIGAAGAVFALVGDDGATSVRGAITSLQDLKRLDAEGAPSAAGSRRQVGRLRDEMRPGERITTLSIRPEYLSAQVSTGHGRPARSITIYTDRAPYTSDGGTGTDRGVSLESLDLAGPARLIAAARRGLGPRSTAKVSYVVLDRPSVEGERAGWAVYFEGTAPDASRWTGDVHGDHVLRATDGAPAPPAGQAGPATLPKGITGASMVRAENLRRAIGLVRAAAPSGSLVTGVDVRAVRVGITTRKSFHERRYTVDAAFGVAASSPGETSQKNGLPFSAVNARGPERALRKIDARAGNRATSRVDYVLLSLPVVFPGLSGQRTTWGVYLAGGSPTRRYWRATLDGRQVGEPGKPGSP